MFDHLSIGVRDVARAKRFYDAALAPLGYTCLSAGDASLGYGDAAVAVWISAAERPVRPDDKSGLHAAGQQGLIARAHDFMRADRGDGGVAREPARHGRDFADQQNCKRPLAPRRR